MTVGRTVGLKPLKEETVPVKSAALVIGGGIGGMTAASVHRASRAIRCILSKRKIRSAAWRGKSYRTLDGGDVQGFLARTIDAVTSHPRITIHLKSKVTKVDGHVGDFTSTIAGPEKTSKSNTASSSWRAAPSSRSRIHSATAESDKVITQLELSGRLARKELALPEKATVVMIQCVEQRTTDRPYCSRVCCTTAVKNALLLRERYPQARIVVLYREMRTYGFREAAYKEAREQRRALRPVRREPTARIDG